MVAGEVINCIDAGACKVMTTNSYYVSIGVFVLAGIFLLLLFFVAFWTPGITFLRAKMSKNPLIYIMNRGQGGKFVVARQKTQGVLDVRRVGPFIMSENSHTREGKSGQPLFFAFGEFAATLPAKWIYMVNKIKQKKSADGQPIHNIEDFGKQIGINYNDATGTWDKV